MLKYSRRAHRVNGGSTNRATRTAHVSLSGATGGTIGGTSAQINTQYPTMNERALLHAWFPTDPVAMNDFCRELYLLDSVLGTGVDYVREMCWGSISLLGADKKALEMYSRSIETLGIESWIGFVTQDFLMLGKACPHFLFDQGRGYFTHAIIHNPDYLQVRSSPVINDPILVDLLPTPAHSNMLRTDDPRLQQGIGQLDSDILEFIDAQQPIPLDPRNTAYVPRRAYAGDIEGVTLYSRALDAVAMETPLMLAHILGNRRRAGALYKITAGSHPDNLPSSEQLNALAAAFLNIQADPIGGALAVTPDVDVQQIKQALKDEMVDYSSEHDILRTIKANAIGLNLAVLDGDDGLTIESAHSLQLDRLFSHQKLMTRLVMTDVIFKGIARANQFVKRTPAELNHRVRSGSSRTLVQHDENLDLPEVHHSRNLQSRAADTRVRQLETAEEHGVPVTTSMWASALEIPIDDAALQKNYEAEIAFKKMSREFQKQLAALEAGEEEDGGLADMLTTAASPTARKERDIAGRATRTASRLALWDRKGCFLDVSQRELNAILSNDAFLAALTIDASWKSVGTYLSDVHDAKDPAKRDTLGFLLSKCGAVRDYTPGTEFLYKFRDRIATAGIEDPSNIGLLKDFISAIELGRLDQQLRSAGLRKMGIPYDFANQSEVFTGVSR